MLVATSLLCDATTFGHAALHYDALINGWGSSPLLSSRVAECLTSVWECLPEFHLFGPLKKYDLNNNGYKY